MFVRTPQLIALASIGAATLLTGCGGDEKDAQSQPPPVQCPPGQFFDGQYCQLQNQQPPPAAAQPPAAAPPPPQAQSGTTNTPAGPVHTSQAGPNATPLDAGAAAAATVLLQPLASQHMVAGSKPVGNAVAGQFQQGQSLQHQIQMQPGKCYTIVAAGAPPISEVNIQLVPALPTIPGAAPLTAAADSDTGNTAVIGKKPNCYKWALPVGGPMTLILSVTGGSGPAAAQVFEK
jgi:hypothetical protein